MSEVRAIFEKVIQAGHYGPDACSYMCNALIAARNQELISEHQRSVATDAIREYMRELGASDYLAGMVDALRYAGYWHLTKGWFETAGTDFYLNWDNRPRRV